MKHLFLKFIILNIYLIFSITNVFSQSFSPMFSHLSGRYNSDIQIQLTTNDSNADIFYTLDGTDPDNSSLEYLGDISIVGDGSIITIKAISISGSSVSNISSAKYILDYSYDPNAEYLTNLTWAEYNEFIKGDWFGYTTNPWTYDYCIELSILPDNKYVGKTTSTSGLLWNDDDEFRPVFYYGVPDASPLKEIEIYDILASGFAIGFVDIVFQQGNTNTDNLRSIKFIDENNLYIEMWHHNMYGPLKYFLTKENAIKTNTSKVFEHQKSMVFPNPASDFITIKSLKSNVQLVNQIGQTFEFGKDEIISVTHLPRGLYIVCYTNNEGFSIKQKIILN